MERAKRFFMRSSFLLCGAVLGGDGRVRPRARIGGRYDAALTPARAPAAAELASADGGGGAAAEGGGGM